MDPTSELAPGAAEPRAAAAAADPQQWFGQPRGLSTLFFTEMWERFSYYGMRALLILFMTAPLAAANRGLGFDVGTAGAVYGLYTSFVYLLALPGGWVADKLWGQRKAVFVGGCVIAAGHFSMAAPLVGLPDIPTFFLGLGLIVVGTGLLKPNVSAMVGDLYPESGARRDAGFSIFYMGINVGAILGPTVCSLLGEGYNFHWGFSAAGFGMVLGLIQYKLGGRYLGDAGSLKTGETGEVLAQRSRNFYLTLGATSAVAVILAFLVGNGVLAITLQTFATGLGYAIIALAILYFVYLFVAGGYDAPQKRRLLGIFWIFILAAIFWSGFEQAGSSMNLFARDLTDRDLGPYPFGSAVVIGVTLLVALLLGWVWGRLARRSDLGTTEKTVAALLGAGLVAFFYWIFDQAVGGWEMPAGWLQNVNPIFIVLLAPVFGTMWVRLAQRNANPSIPMKFALGLLGLAAGFFVLSWGAANATAENPVSPAWLIVTYFLHTVGELCLSPVGLSSITKLAPADRVGQMMGIWFIAAALGNLFAGLFAGALENISDATLFWRVALFITVAGVLAMLLAPVMRRVIGKVE
ncbi:MAG TPA: oligopeptide:H+ symporter [Thermoanaerobaculia bacterium]|nr:oligopeptide:H+ symporter [Thermoanaerobaculia bacterium]